ncbi:MAG: hypothetical protein HW421_2644 [Ignavibacteria bacterium]|nr:hypothetical protein [Ignavibacteria bacterium]
MTIIKGVIKYIFLLTVLIETCSSLYAQGQVYIFGKDVSKFPNITAQYMAFDTQGELIDNLSESDFLITENNKTYKIQKNYCKSPNKPSDLSMVICLDLAKKSFDNIPNNFVLAKSLATALITRLKKNKFETAITAFDKASFLAEDFTNNTNTLLTSINNLSSYNCSILDEGLLSEPAGALPIASTGKYKRSVVLITNNIGHCSVDSIIKAAKSDSIKIFCISLGNSMSHELKKIADSTNGKWFENITSDSIAQVVLALAQERQPCSITWQNEITCGSEQTVLIFIPKLSISGNIRFQLQESIKPLIITLPEEISFNPVLPGGYQDIKLRLKAEKSSLTINSLSIANPAFRIIQGNIISPVTLTPGDTHNIVVRFEPTDSAIVFTSLNIESSACYGNQIFMSGGFPNIPPKEKNLKIISPICNEKYLINDTIDIKWSGLLKKDIIQLEYSSDEGSSWATLTRDISGLIFKWKLPNFPIPKCRIRAIQLWPNNVGPTMDFNHKQGVNCANFSRNTGSLIITAGKDSLATIWEANTGKKLFDLRGHKASVNWTEFSPDDLFAASGSDDSTAILWDVSSGKQIKSFRLDGDVKTVSFSYDGKFLVTASIDGIATVWRISDGALIKSIRCLPNQLWFAFYDLKDENILVGGIDRYVKLWNIAADSVIKTFDTEFGYNSGGCFSRDGKRFVTASWMGNAIVWDVASGNVLARFSHKNDNSSPPILYASFDKTGDTVLTASVDMDARMWCVSSNNLEKVFHEHKNTVKTAVFNFDNSRVLTSSWDYTAKFWNREKRDLQSDTGSCYFSVVNPDVICKDVDFGNVIEGDSKDTLVKAFIINSCGALQHINSISLKGSDSSDFILHNPQIPFTLNKEPYPLEIYFKPSKTGTRTATIEVDIDGRKIISKLTGKSVESEMEIRTRTIDFKYVELGDFKDTVISALLINKRAQPIEISSVNLYNQSSDNFDLLSGNSILTLNYLDSMEVRIRYIPVQLGRSRGQLAIRHSGKEGLSNINIYGVCIPPIIDTITLSIADASAKPDEIINVPVYTNFTSDEFPHIRATGITTQLRFNATLLEPLGDFKSDTIFKNERTIQFNIPITKQLDTTSIKFRTGLGNDTMTILTIEYPSPINNAKVKINTRNGIFKLLGLCTDGGLRLFDGEGKIYLQQNFPNPATNLAAIEFEVTEPGITQIVLSDYLGNYVKTIYYSNTAKGKHLFEFSVEDLPVGMYFYTLSTPTQQITRKMSIVK